jgi:hypothetical protein
VLFGLVLLVVAGLVVVARLGRLARAAARVQRQIAGADALQTSLAQLQERMVELQEHAAGIQARAGRE